MIIVNILLGSILGDLVLYTIGSYLFARDDRKISPIIINASL